MSSLDYLRFVLSLLFVLGLVLGVAWAARRFGFGTSAPRRRAHQRRLTIVEVQAVDAKRRLVLVRRDATEHLLLIGGTTDLVVETGIPAAESFDSALAVTNDLLPEKSEKPEKKEPRL